MKEGRSLLDRLFTEKDPVKEVHSHEVAMSEKELASLLIKWVDEFFISCRERISLQYENQEGGMGSVTIGRSSGSFSLHELGEYLAQKISELNRDKRRG